MRSKPSRLLVTMLIEVCQSETSTMQHPLREANRLGSTPPGHAMRALSAQARTSLAALERVSACAPLPPRRFALGLGSTFSMVREHLGDVLVTREMSYRGTLLGVHHGVDAVELLRATALHESQNDIVDWCVRTLEERRPLMADLQTCLVWFGENPELAMQPAKATLAAIAVRSLISSVSSRGLRPRAAA